MDRLARNLDDLRRLVRELTGKGVKISFIKEGLTFTGDDSPIATLLRSVLSFEPSPPHAQWHSSMANSPRA
jgi:DNA invertase Pin-like site-specific DNA recombinase